MARQGASLQNYNNELVKSLEDLCKRRHALQSLIESEEKEKTQLESEKMKIEERLQVVGCSLDKKLATRQEYDRVIEEAETAYIKILESSQALLNVVNTKSHELKNTDKSKVTSTTPDSGYPYTCTPGPPPSSERKQ